VFDNGFRVGFNNIEPLKEKITVVKGSVSDVEDWKKLPKDIESAFHLAAINGTRFFYEIPEKILEVNVQGTLNFVKWLGNSNVKKIFFASSSEVYGFPKVFPTSETEPLTVPNPTNPRFSYSSSKIIGETITINYSRKYGIDFTIARFHNVYGPHMGFEHVIPEFIRKCVKNEPFTIQGDGTQSRCFCYISDAVDGVMLINEHPKAKNGIYNIGTNEEVCIRELVLMLEKIHGKKIDPVYEEFQNAGTKKRVPSIAKIRELGYKPKISLEEGLRNTYEWYANYYKSN